MSAKAETRRYLIYAPGASANTNMRSDLTNQERIAADDISNRKRDLDTSTTPSSYGRHLNGLQESIKFTRELEVENKILFLDVLIHKKSDGKLRTTAYKKLTHRGQYLHFDSNHPHNVRMSIVECVYDRALRDVSSDDEK
ncbi:hypothetical protein Trydic_g14901 [Trypoxylus dichotomus]